MQQRPTEHALDSLASASAHRAGLEGALHGSLVLSGFLGPLLGMFAGLLWARRRASRSAGWGCISGFAAGCAYGLVALVYGFCFPAPGEGADAQYGFAHGQVLIGALEAYRARAHAPPDSLGALVPEFLASRAWVDRCGPLARCFVYTRQGDAYELSFQYAGPGMNTCTWTTGTRRWDCSGYF